MDDTLFGSHNKRGDFRPNEALKTTPLWIKPLDLKKILQWIPGYLFPWNFLWLISAVLYWELVIPEKEVMQTLSWGWIFNLFLVNGLAITAWFGVFEWQLYHRRNQGKRFKYNGLFPAEKPMEYFWFKSQNIDNYLRVIFSSVVAWTLIEVLMLWGFANGNIPWLVFADSPWQLALVFLAVPFIQEAHFYCIHRLIHIEPLYKWIHSIHHNSINPSPWSSLSMHPGESLPYFGVALWHLLLPSNPFLMIYQLHQASFGAIVGHIGFDQIEIGKDSSFKTHAYPHYLHHKYFDVNYSDGLLPLDRLFGTWHDGTKESDKAMQERFKKRMALNNQNVQRGTE